MNKFLTTFRATIEAMVKLAAIAIGFTICLFLIASVFSVGQPLSGIMGGILLVIALCISTVMGRKEYYKKNGIDPVTKKKL